MVKILKPKLKGDRIGVTVSLSSENTLAKQ
jgi:hypothetical protein